MHQTMRLDSGLGASGKSSKLLLIRVHLSYRDELKLPYDAGEVARAATDPQILCCDIGDRRNSKIGSARKKVRREEPLRSTFNRNSTLRTIKPFGGTSESELKLRKRKNATDSWLASSIYEVGQYLSAGGYHYVLEHLCCLDYVACLLLLSTVIPTRSRIRRPSRSWGGASGINRDLDVPCRAVDGHVHSSCAMSLFLEVQVKPSES